MNNLRISIDLSKLEGSRTLSYRDENGTFRYYHAIPMDDLFCPEQTEQRILVCNAIYTPNNAYGKTHLIKPTISKFRYDQMTEDEKRAIPIIGNVKMQTPQVPANVVTQATPAMPPIEPYQSQPAKSHIVNPPAAEPRNNNGQSIFPTDIPMPQDFE